MLNPSHSTQGRAWAKSHDLSHDMAVELDGGFTCHRSGLVMLERDSTGVFFRCDEGKHYVDDQADDGIHCIGIYAPPLSMYDFL